MRLLIYFISILSLSCGRVISQEVNELAVASGARADVSFTHRTTVNRPKLLSEALLARRSLHEAGAEHLVSDQDTELQTETLSRSVTPVDASYESAPVPSDTGETGFAELGDTFFLWFVLGGFGWCLYHSCKPGGCCRGSRAARHFPQGRVAAPEAPIGTQNQHGVILHAGQVPPGQQWLHGIHPHGAVAQVQLGQQSAPGAAAQPSVHFQKEVVPKVPSQLCFRTVLTRIFRTSRLSQNGVLQEAPTALYRVGSHRWSTTPLEPTKPPPAAPAAAAAAAVAPAAAGAGAPASPGSVSEGESGLERFHSTGSSADISVYLPAPIAVETASSHTTADGDTSSLEAAGGPPLATPTAQDPGAPCSHTSQQGTLSNHSSASASAAPQPPLAGVATSSSVMGSEKECVICYDETGDHVMVPCGHGGFCGRCAKDMCTGHAPPYTAETGHVCPVCRAPVHAVVKVSLNTAVGSHSAAECALIVADAALEAPRASLPPIAESVIIDALREHMIHVALRHPHANLHSAHVVIAPPPPQHRGAFLDMFENARPLPPSPPPAPPR